MDFKYKSTENVMTERQWLESGAGGGQSWH